jgi:hypothetical protein
MSKHRKASGPKPRGDRKQKANGKKDVKDKTVAAEIGAAVMREEAPKPPPPPVQRPPAPAVAKTLVKEIAEEEVSERPSRLLDTTVHTFERSFKAAGQGTIAVNRKLLDFARANVSSGFDLAISLASASSPMQFMQLQMEYWDERLKALVSQAQELRVLSADVVAKASEPIREHMWTTRANA